MSMLEVFPPLISMYPTDEQIFTARGVLPTAMWHSITNGTVQSDYSVKVTSVGTTTTARIVYEAYSGQVSAQWLVNDKWVASNSSGALRVKMFNAAGTYNIQWRFEQSAFKLWEGATGSEAQVGSFAYGAGVFVTNNTFRVFYDGYFVKFFCTGIASTSAGSATTGLGWPIYIVAELIAPIVDAAPAIPAMLLTGDWRLKGSAISWSGPGYGSLSSSTGNQITYFAPTFGTGSGSAATITAVIENANDNGNQEAVATLVLPSLSIISESPVTLQPSEKVRFKTNYDNAKKTQTVTWSVVSGGGSFTNGEYTASSSPGDSVIRATAGSQTYDITVTVPTVVTATYTAAQPGEQVTFSTNMTGTKTWSADYGTASGSGAAFAWTAPNQAGIDATVTVTNGTLTVPTKIPVLKLFPYTPTFPTDWARKKTVLISRAEDRTRRTRVKDKNGLPFEDFELRFRNRDVTELLAAQDFIDEHYPGKRVIFTDALRNEVGQPAKRIVAYIDSDMNVQAAANCAVDYAFRISEA